MASDDKSLHDLFASLRSSPGNWAQSSGHQAPGLATRQSPAEPTSPPDQAGNADRTASLLSLLKFNQSGQQQQQQQPSPHGRGVSTSDLVASYMGKPTASSRDPASAPPLGDSLASSNANPQDYLLQLLNRAQFGNGSSHVQSSAPPPAKENRSAMSDQRQLSPDPTQRDSPIRVFGSSESRELTPFDPQDMPKMEPRKDTESKPVFTYVNPFEQLAASSPRNAGTPAGNATPHRDTNPLPKPQLEGNRPEKKLNISTASRPVASLAGASEEVLPSIETPLASQSRGVKSPFGTSDVLGAPTTDTATVAQALNEVGEQVSRQADLALVEAEKKTKRAKAQKSEEVAVEKALQDAAVQVKKDLGDGAERALNEILPEHAAKEVKQIINEAAEGHVDGHGSADDEKSSANAEEDFIVPVYNFVMKPFISIDLIQSNLPQISFREDTVTDIARLKKEFDQIDRTLATASGEYIVYSLPRSGGIRVIRQEDGVDRHVFRDTRDHVFNVALSTAPRGKSTFDLQTSIATATSGAVYWTALHHNDDKIEADSIEEHSLTFPPVSAQEEHTSGGQLKTRAKRSSRHPEFFAIGRGKAIQIVFPLHAAQSNLTNKKKIVNTDAYFKQRSLRINTGKAGKDFTFSEDDTVIASLDKTGRLRFWDIRELVDESHNDAPEIAPVEIRTPIITYSTAMPTEKSWPTSVLFVDKLRAYAKGTALRYIIVGMKQNHTLQLWDLGIGKVIQEVHFPHSKESDAICSVCYHPGSGIIVVGHPTRNSIYFIHLSAPKYNLPGMTQARFMSRLADKDSSLPKLEATAIMSGMREYTFASKGQLRSVDLLSVSNDGPVSKEAPALFELYVMHSKGVTMLSIDRGDLGWSEDMKVLNPISAEEAGMIRIRDIQQPPAVIMSENSSVNGDAMPVPAKIWNDKPSTALTKTGDKADKAMTDDTDLGESKALNGPSTPTDKAERRKKKKTGGSAEPSSVTVPPPAPVAPATYASTAAKAAAVDQSGSSAKEPSRPAPKRRSSGKGDSVDSDSITLDVSSDFIDKELQKIEANVSAEFSRVFKQHMDTLYKRLNDDRRVTEAQNGANQEAVLRLVSKSLSENVESSLRNIILQSIQKEVVPAIKSNTVAAVERDIVSGVSKTISSSIRSQLKHSLTEAATEALQDANFMQASSNQISSNVMRLLTAEMDNLVTKNMTSKVRAATTEAVEKVSSAHDLRLDRVLLDSAAQRQADAAKVDQLMYAVEKLSSAVLSLEATQRQLREEVLRLRGGPPQAAEVQASESVSPDRSRAAPQRHSEDTTQTGDEVRLIAEAMNSGDFEDAMVKWLQSQDQGELFDNYFVKVNPQYLQHCSTLVTLSVAAAVTASLQNNLVQRLVWLDTVLESIDLEDSDMKEVAPRIMGVICQRLEAHYMHLTEHDPADPSLKRIPRLTRKARDISGMLQRQ